MKYRPLSRSAYLVAAIIVLIYILSMLLKAYAFYHTPPAEATWDAVLFQGSWPLHLAYSCAMLGCYFALLYPFLVICWYNYSSAPIAAVLAFVGILFFCLLKICWQFSFLLQMQTDLPGQLMTMNGPNVMENVLRKFTMFRFLQWVLDFPLACFQIIASLFLAITFSRQPTRNYLVKAAFYINACYYVVYLSHLSRGKYEIMDYNKPFLLPISLLVYVLILVWLIISFRELKANKKNIILE